MGKIIKVEKSRKMFKCSKCGQDIPKGSSYYRGQLNFAHDIIRCSKCKLKPWEVTTSDYVLAVGPIVNEWRENYGVDEQTPEQIAAELESIRDDVQERLDNMPEGLQEGDIGQKLQERIDNLETAIDELYSIDIESIKSEIVDVLLSVEDHIFLPKDGEEDYDTIFENNEILQEQMAEDFTDMLSSEIESALEYIEV